MKRILITGAAGTVGKEITKQLCEFPGIFEVTVFDRKTAASIQFFSKFKIKPTVFYGDIRKKEDISRACKNKDIIFHLAAIIPPVADQLPQLAREVNITGTRNLVESIEELSPDAFVIYASSVSIYGDRNIDPWIKVTDTLKPSKRDEYARTKIEGEKLIRQSNLRWSIFRLCAIIGIGSHKFSPTMFHMPLNTKMEIATPGDTARAFIYAVKHLDKLNKNIYNLGGGEKCRIEYNELLSRCFDIMGLGALDLPAHTFAAKNFHCGLYADGHILNDILDFRRDTIDDYFKNLERSIAPAQKVATRIFRNIIKRNLIRQSEPLAAIRKNIKEDIEHFF